MKRFGAKWLSKHRKPCLHPEYEVSATGQHDPRVGSYDYRWRCLECGLVRKASLNEKDVAVLSRAQVYEEVRRQLGMR